MKLSTASLDGVGYYGDNFPEFFRRAKIANSFYGSINRFFTAGIVLQLISLSIFNVDTSAYIKATAIIVLAGFAQVLGLFASYKFGPFATLIWSYRLRSVALFAAIISVWLATFNRDLSWSAFTVSAFVIMATNAAGFNVCWPPIIRCATLGRKRGQITSTLRSIQAVIASFLVLLISLAGPAYFNNYAFSGLIVVFLVYSIVAERQIKWMQYHVSLAPNEQSHGVLKTITQDARTLLGNRSFRSLSLIVLLFGLCTFPIPVFYLRDVIKLPVGSLFWFVTAVTWIGIASIKGWGWAIDRLGVTHVIRAICFSFFVVYLAFLSFAIVHSMDPLISEIRVITSVFFLALFGMLTQGASLSWFNYSLEVIPKEQTSSGVLLLSLLLQLSVFVGGVSGALLLHYASRSSYIVADVIIGVVWVSCSFTAVHFGKALEKLD